MVIYVRAELPRARLLWYDLHVNSSPDYSADEVVNKIIAHLEAAMQSELQAIFEDRERIFQKTYFIETIG